MKMSGSLYEAMVRADMEYRRDRLSGGLRKQRVRPFPVRWRRPRVVTPPPARTMTVDGTATVRRPAPAGSAHCG